MIACALKTCVKTLVRFGAPNRRQMSNQICNWASQSPSSACCLSLSLGYAKPKYIGMSIGNINSSLSLRQRSYGHSLTAKNAFNSRHPRKTFLDISLGLQTMNLKLLVGKQGFNPRMKSYVGPISWFQGCAYVGLIFGLLVRNSISEPAHAEAPLALAEDKKENDCDSSTVTFSHGKQVYSDYSVIGIPGDGRCLFRSVAHGACLRSGKPAPDETLQRELADELRARVADEFIKRRKDTECYYGVHAQISSIDIKTFLLIRLSHVVARTSRCSDQIPVYSKVTLTPVSKMRKPHVWGGEPELLMASHVLKMPITVYMKDQDSGGLISIAEYGQEYSTEDPIRVLYHGFGHYDALHLPGKKSARSRL